MDIVDQKLRRMTAASISTPARKVKRIAPNPASQLIQSLSCRWRRLPAMAPTMISVNATETVSQTDNTDAASANPIHNAAISQTFATGTSLFPAHLGGGTGTLPPRLQAQQELSAFRRFRGGSIPIMGKAPYSGGTEHVNTQSGLPMANSGAPAAVADPVEEPLPRRRAIVFIVFLGVISLFGDMTYEGARSITGPYLGMLGVTATTIGVVAGFGELMGYGARLVSGYVG